MKRLTLVLALAVLLAGAQPLVATARPERSGRKAQTITRTFQSAKEITILDFAVADPYPSVINVSGLKRGKVRDVNLTLRGLSHGFPADLDFLLVSPSSRSATVLSDVGADSPGGDSDPVVNINLILDDQAAKPLPATGRLTAARFRPRNVVGNDGNADPFPLPSEANPNARLSTFNGIKANGDWELFIFDDGNIDGGRLANGWELKIETKVKSGGKKGGTGSRQRRNHEERPAADRPRPGAAPADEPVAAAAASNPSAARGGR